MHPDQVQQRLPLLVIAMRAARISTYSCKHELQLLQLSAALSLHRGSPLHGASWTAPKMVHHGQPPKWCIMDSPLHGVSWTAPKMVYHGQSTKCVPTKTTTQFQMLFRLYSYAHTPIWGDLLRYGFMPLPCLVAKSAPALPFPWLTRCKD